MSVRNGVVSCLVILATVLLTGCSGSTSASPQATVTVTAPAAPDTSQTDSAEDFYAEDPPAAESTAVAPPTVLKIGQKATVGDWIVTLTAVNKNANRVIANANQFNSEPKGRYVLVTFTAKYQGSERIGNAGSDLTWSLTDTQSTVNDSAFAVTPADKNDWPDEARRGGTIRGQEVFDVPKNRINGSLVSVKAFVIGGEDPFADWLI
jgi:hypothetical protein